MIGNGDGLSRLLAAAAAQLDVSLAPDVLWTSGAYVCRLVERDRLVIEGPNGPVLEYTLPGVDIAALA